MTDPTPDGQGRPQQPSPPPPPEQTASAAGPGDDVWGVRPPALGNHGQQGYGPGHSTGAPTDPPPGASTGSTSGPTGTTPGGSSLDRSFSVLKRSPLRRDTSEGVIGGVCAGIARQLGVSTAAVRVGAVVLALFFGSGVAAYLIAWALLPDDDGDTHLEQGIKGGEGSSIALLVVAGISALGMLGTLLDGLRWLAPVVVTAAIVAYVVHASSKKGDGR